MSKVLLRSVLALLGLSIAIEVSAQGAIVAGADAGGAPNVIINEFGTHQNLGSFFAYAPAFTGGVRVAVGDVNGDGRTDIITGAGAGGGPQVSVFDAKTHTPINSFFAYSPSFTGGVYVAAGDVNGDGHTAIVTGSGSGGVATVSTFSGSGQLLHSFTPVPSAFAGGVRVATGDIEGNGPAQIIAGPGPGGPPVAFVFSATGTLIDAIPAYAPQFTGGIFVAAGDVNGDGHADIITGPDAGGAPEVKVFSGVDGSLLRDFLAYDPSFSGGVRVAAADVNGDGVADIITGAGPGGGPHVKVFDGKTGALLDSYFAFDPGFTGGIFVAGVQAVPEPHTDALLVAGLLLIAVAVQRARRITSLAAPTQ
jgi:hypothetical protein